MTRNHYNLRKIIELDKWQKLQDSLSVATGMAIILVDYKGIPVSKHSGCREFCSRVREDDEESRYCQKCDSRGGLESVCSNKPYIYLCHYNIVDMAIPIIVDDSYVGAVLAGQVTLEKEEEENSLEKILACTSTKMDRECRLEYEQIPRMSYEKILIYADMLYELCNYIVSEALNKKLITELYEKEVKDNYDSSKDIDLSGYDSRNIKSVKDELTRAITNHQLSEVTYDKKKLSRTIIFPAVEYIYNHKDETVSLKRASELCHISESYFSRLFQKIMGVNYSHYISQLKIDWAKELLITTDMAVGGISDNLGFSDAGYFIKIFKKFEGVTPYTYRKFVVNEQKE